MLVKGKLFPRKAKEETLDKVNKMKKIIQKWLVGSAAMLLMAQTAPFPILAETLAKNQDMQVVVPNTGQSKPAEITSPIESNSGTEPTKRDLPNPTDSEKTSVETKGKDGQPDAKEKRSRAARVNFRANELAPEGKMGSLKVTKTDERDQPITGAVFTLTQTDGEKTVEKMGEKGNLSEFLFTNLRPGYYTLEETKAPAGYRKTDKTWQVFVRKDGVVKISENSTDELDKPTLPSAPRDITQEIQLSNENVSFDGNQSSLKTNSQILYNVDIKPQETANIGDYFYLILSKTLTHNQLNPEKSVSRIIRDSKGIPIAKEEQTREIQEVNSPYLSRIKYTLLRPGNEIENIHIGHSHSIRLEEVRCDGSYDFSYQFGRHKSAVLHGMVQFSPFYESPTSYYNNLKLNVAGRVYRMEDIGNSYTSLYYINPKGTYFGRDGVQVDISPENNGKYITNAFVSSKFTEVEVYKYKKVNTSCDNVINGSVTPDLAKATKLSTSQQASEPYIESISFDDSNRGKATVRIKNVGDWSFIVTSKSYRDDSVTGGIVVERAHLSALDSTGKLLPGGQIDKWVAIGFTSSNNGGDLTSKPDEILELRVKNEKQTYGQFDLIKANELREPLSGALFKLYEGDIKSQSEAEFIKNKQPFKTIVVGTEGSEKGKSTVKDLPEGVYTLIESQAPTGYQKTAETWTITVDKSGNSSIKVNNSQSQSDIKEDQITIDGKAITSTILSRAVDTPVSPKAANSSTITAEKAKVISDLVGSSSQTKVIDAFSGFNPATFTRTITKINDTTYEVKSNLAPNGRAENISSGEVKEAVSDNFEIDLNSVHFTSNVGAVIEKSKNTIGFNSIKLTNTNKTFEYTYRIKLLTQDSGTYPVHTLTIARANKSHKLVSVDSLFKVNVQTTAPQLPDVIPSNQGVSKPSNYVEVKFASSVHGHLEGNMFYYVNSTKGVTLDKLALPTPIADEGYVFKGWSPSLDKDKAITSDKTYTAIFEKKKPETVQKPILTVINRKEIKKLQFYIQKLDGDKTEKPLIKEGKLKLKLESAKNHLTKEFAFDLSQSSTFTTIHNQEALLIEIPDDWQSGDYTLTETQAPKGFGLTGQVFNLHLDRDKQQIQLLEQGQSKQTLMAGNASDELHISYDILKIENHKPEFPRTGGFGSFPYFLVGSILVLLAFVYHWKGYANNAE
ncbi:prealbumin-like fold domain-containing protein [Streptococcus halichoeri]|uniref:prealbumin-like fold domain-containing protein n=1 Tax=Streptococcus halichoeri TaxID=254785 RepID=UPI0013586C1F|nr:prealbumin-like fold domain-containing protein [Streptococcus halichoeri]